MKKLVSLLLALVFCVSLFAFTAVAFAADETDKPTPKSDLVGSWTDDNNSRVKFTEKDFSGNIYGDGISGSLSVSGKYTYVNGEFVATPKDGSNWEVKFDKDAGTISFIEKAADDDGDAVEPEEPAEPGDGEEEEEPKQLFNVVLKRHTVTYEKTKYDELTNLTGIDKVQAATENFRLDYEWLKDESFVRQLFPGINYILKFGDWTAEVDSSNENKLNVTWTIDSDHEYTAILDKKAADGDDTTTPDNKYVGTWTADNLSGKPVEMVFTATHVTIKRDGFTVTDTNGTSYTLDADNKATFTTGSTAKPYETASYSDKIVVQYATPTVDYKDYASWNTVDVDTAINIIGTTSSTSRLGWWVFQFAARDSAGTVLTDNKGNEMRTTRIDVWFYDGTAPQYRDNNGLTSDMISVRDNGLTAGETYTIKTNLRYIDNGNVTVNYTVYKWDVKNNKWVSILVKGESVAEGYEDYITAAGVITPKESDILKDNKPMYKIVYTLTDDQLYESDPTELLLFVKKADSDGANSTLVWQIILYVIAGLSAVGIVVVLLIKPKQPQTEDARIGKSNSQASGNVQADNTANSADADGGDQLDE